MTDSILILDACALIAAQRGEEGGEKLLEWLADADRQVIMHGLNLCEVFYDALRRDSSTHLDSLFADANALGIRIETELGFGLIERAGRLKAHWRRISLADCVALALAEQLGGCLVTTDHHEFDSLSAAGHPVVFLR
jgi:predicted nucleic acid-binding protein